MNDQKLTLSIVNGSDHYQASLEMLQVHTFFLSATASRRRRQLAAQTRNQRLFRGSFVSPMRPSTVLHQARSPVYPFLFGLQGVGLGPGGGDWGMGDRGFGAESKLALWSKVWSWSCCWNSDWAQTRTPKAAGRSFPSLGFCLSVSSSANTQVFMHVFAVNFCSVRTYLHL